MAQSEVQVWLEAFLQAHGGVAGTVHYQRGGDLHLAAHHNIPPHVKEVVELVPRGKGMAGEAQVRRQPVQTCNIKDDNTGRLKPLAKEVSGLAAVALPVLDPTGEVRAVVGISFGHEGEIPAGQVETLMRAASALP